MPEGPEVLIHERFLRKKIIGKKLNKIISNTKRYVILPNPSIVVDTGSKGKVFWIRTKSYYLHIHLGLSGWFVDDKPEIFKYALVVGDKRYYLRDRRRFSKIKIFNTEKDHKKDLNRLGVSILSEDFTRDLFIEKLGSRKMNISAFLLDQGIFSGVGNYIRNEALYISGVNPKRKTETINEKEAAKLYDAIRYVSFSVAMDWFKLYKISFPLKKIKPKKAKTGYRFRVYGRDNDLRGNRVKKETVAGRDTYYIPSLQR